MNRKDQDYIDIKYFMISVNIVKIKLIDFFIKENPANLQACKATSNW